MTRERLRQVAEAIAAAIQVDEAVGSVGQAAEALRAQPSRSRHYGAPRPR